MAQKQKKRHTIITINAETLREAKRLKLNISALSEEALKGAIANMESHPSGGLATVAGIERERKRVAIVSQVYSIFMDYTVPLTMHAKLLYFRTRLFCLVRFLSGAF